MPRFLRRNTVPTWDPKAWVQFGFEVSQIIIHAADPPDIVVDFLDADGLAGEDLAEVNLFVPQTDASAVGDDDLVMEGKVDVGQSAIRTSRRLINLSRAFHIERFMRPPAIENFHEVIEAGLNLAFARHLLKKEALP